MGRGVPGLGISKDVWFEKDGITWCRLFAPPPPIFSVPLSFSSLGFLFVGLVFGRFGNSASGARTEKLRMTSHLTVE